MSVTVIDDFIPQDLFNEMMDYIPKDIPWEYEDFSVNEDDDVPQFVHLFYQQYRPQSEYFDDILPVLECIDDLYCIFRVKVNGTMRGDRLKEKPYHIDAEDTDTNVIPPLKICILMLNDNNGYTQIKDKSSGTKRLFKSKANRALFFPNTYEHMGTNCTDQNLRMTLNIVYA